MKTSLHTIGLTVLSAAVVTAAAACSAKNNDAADGGASSSSSSSSGDGGGSSSSSGDGGPIGMATSCSTGSLYAGNPVYDGTPSDRPTTGTGILADPPLQWSSLTFAGDILYTRDTGEIWAVDTSAAAPVETLVLGKNAANFNFNDGPCATARLTAVQGIVALADGSLVATDAFANAVVHIKNPKDAATCAVEYWAGNNTPATDIDPMMSTPNPGDVDGPLGTSRLNFPTAITTDDAGIVYFFDADSHKIKMIANDAVHTVTSLGKAPAAIDKVWNMTHIGSTLYGMGYDGNVTTVFKFDTASKTFSTVISGNGTDDTFDPISGATPLLGGITTDGANLLISGKGYLWSLTTNGKLSLVAGAGENIDWPTADAKKTSAALDLQLVSAKGSSAAAVGSPDYITYHNGAVYVRSHGAATAAYVTKISCP